MFILRTIIRQRPWAGEVANEDASLARRSLGKDGLMDCGGKRSATPLWFVGAVTEAGPIVSRVVRTSGEIWQ